MTESQKSTSRDEIFQHIPALTTISKIKTSLTFGAIPPDPYAYIISMHDIVEAWLLGAMITLTAKIVILVANININPGTDIIATMMLFYLVSVVAYFRGLRRPVPTAVRNP